MAKISPISKSDDPQKYDDYCPITVLPLFSKVYKRLIAKKLSAFLERSCTLKDNIAGFRKLHSANILLLKIRDDILRAMSKGELYRFTVIIQKLLIQFNTIQLFKSSIKLVFQHQH